MCIRPSPLSWISFPSRPSRGTELSSLLRGRGAPWAVVALNDSMVHLSVPISHHPHPSFPPGSHAFVLCAGFKGMMELQLCLEKGHRLGGWSMNIMGYGVTRPTWGLGTTRRGRTCHEVKDAHFNWPWKLNTVEHLYLQVQTNRGLNIFGKTIPGSSPKGNWSLPSLMASLYRVFPL